MPPKKASTKSPYFKATPPARKSNRVSNTSLSSAAKKRQFPSSESEFDDDDLSGSDFRITKKGRKSNTGRRSRVKRSESEDESSHLGDEHEGEDDGDTDDEAKPPKTVIIPLPKVRDAGDIPYEDGRLHGNTMLFLKDLKKNNNREWMKFNDGEFRQAQKDFSSFVEELGTLVTEKDFTIPELPSKDLIFRIYRDVRFSNDPTPYKPNFAAAWSRTGKKGPYAFYYLHLQPDGHSFLGGGLYSPEASALERLREDINQAPHHIRRALMSADLRRDFFDGEEDEKAVVAAFVSNKTNAESALKTKPRGYEADHRDIKLLRLKNYTIGRKLEDSELTSADALEKVAGYVGSLVPLITYLNSVVMPDRNAANNSDSDDDDQEDAEDGEDADN